jgi:cobalt-zinc-cadmium efflux system protein
LVQLEVVDEVHDFHIWSISAEKPILTAHVVSQHPSAFVLYEITKMLQSKFEIYHSTIQVEANPHKDEPEGGPKLTNCINEYNFAVGTITGN